MAEKKETVVDEEFEPLTGECMCGRVKFTISKPLFGAINCYCKRCQRRTGTAFSISGLTQPNSFEVTEGHELVKIYRPEEGWVKYFCEGCGGQLFTTNPDKPELLAVRLGAVDGDPGVRTQLHQFTDYVSPWYEIPDDGLPRHPERMPWS